MSNQTLTTQKAKVDVLKGVLNAPSVQEQFRNALNDNASTFIASVIDLYNTDSKLQLCEPKQVVMSALQAAVLKLPINKALGYAYILPYANNKKVTDPATGRDTWQKVMEPTFQMGYKGYIQLAMRTGQYRTINSGIVYEGEISSVNKLTGEIRMDGVAKSDKVIGYFAYIELLNGFSKTLYMTVEEMASHAKKYSKGLSADTTEASLIALASSQKTPDGKTAGWKGNFHAMALKTVVRLLLSKYGYLSIEMQNAITSDLSGETVDASKDEVREEQVKEIAPRATIDFGEDEQAVNMPQEEPGEEEVKPESSEEPGF